MTESVSPWSFVLGPSSVLGTRSVRPWYSVGPSVVRGPRSVVLGPSRSFVLCPVEVAGIERASNGELKFAFYAAEGRNDLAATETADLIELNESIAKMLRRWQATLEPTNNPRRQTKREPGIKRGPRTQHPARTQDKGPSTD